MNYLELYRDYLIFERSLSNKTIETYLTQLKNFLTYLKSNNLTVDNANSDDIRKFIELGKENDVKDATISLRITVLKSFYRFLNNDNLSKNNPTLVIEFNKPVKKIPTVLTVEEVDKILSVIDESKPNGFRDKTLIEFLFSTGARVSEVVELKLNQLNFSENTVILHGKGGKDRITFIGEIAANYLAKYLNEIRPLLLKDRSSTYVFVGKENEKLNRTYVLTIVKKYAKIAGIEKTISPHTFRHSFATSLLENGADLITVKTLLGHQNVETTTIYTHISNKHLLDVYNKAHPFGRKETNDEKI